MADVLKASYLSNSSQQQSQGERTDRQVSKLLGNKIFKKKMNSKQELPFDQTSSFQESHKQGIFTFHQNSYHLHNQTSIVSDDSSQLIEHSQVLEQFHLPKDVNYVEPTTKKPAISTLLVSANKQQQINAPIESIRSQENSPMQVKMTNNREISRDISRDVSRDKSYSGSNHKQPIQSEQISMRHMSTIDKQTNMIHQSNIIQSLNPLIQKQTEQSQRLMTLEFELQTRTIKLPVFANDNSFSLTYRLLKQLNVQTTPMIIEKTSDIIQKHIDDYILRLDDWSRLRRLGDIDSVKWKAQAIKDPNILQKVEDEDQAEFSSSYLKREIIESSIELLPKGMNVQGEQIGILHVDQEGKQIGIIKIHHGEDPHQCVQRFYYQKGLPHRQHQFDLLVNEVNLIQQEFRHGQHGQSREHRNIHNTNTHTAKSITPIKHQHQGRERSKSPSSNQVRVEQFKIGEIEQLKNNPQANLIQAQVQIGKDRKFQVQAKRVSDNLGKVIDRISIEQKLTKYQRQCLEEQILKYYKKAQLQASLVQ